MPDHLPELVRIAARSAERAGFSMSCHPDTGRLLAALVAGVRSGGRVLELGTGAGVGTGWIIHGLEGRTDVSVTTVEIDPATAALASANPWPSWVQVVVGDALEVVPRSGRFDLVFADAQGGKWEGLDRTVEALRPGGQLLVDDMDPATYANDHHREKTQEVRQRLLADPRLQSVELRWSTGLVLSTRRHRAESA